jgi:hypothetical protein
MKKLAAVLAALALTATGERAARADAVVDDDTGGAGTAAVGLEFGYPGNIGLSLRFGRTPINLAWGQDWLHGTVDYWVLREPIAPDAGLSVYIGPGLDAGIPLDDSENFALAVRVPIGLQWMVTDRVETFAELARASSSWMRRLSTGRATSASESCSDGRRPLSAVQGPLTPDVYVLTISDATLTMRSLISTCARVFRMRMLADPYGSRNNRWAKAWS